MKKTIIIIIVLLAIGLGIYFITSNNSNNIAPAAVDNTSTTPIVTTTPSADVITTPPPVVNNPTPVAPASASVSIKNFSFIPATLNIKKGTKVTWVNNDTVPHTVTSDVGNLLNSGTLAPGQSFSFTFTGVGSTNYHCTIHPMMKATVVVAN